MIVSCPLKYVRKEDGVERDTIGVFYVDPSKKAYIRIKTVFQSDRRLLLAVATSLDSMDDVIRAAGLEPREKASGKK